MTDWKTICDWSERDVLTWAEQQPWAQAMAACGQDAVWHAEGDVWTHTRMVVDQLGRLPEWPTLDARSRRLLLFTALFHDSGKPATTMVDPETGRTRSPKHALVGMEIARNTLRSLGCDLVFREEVVQLVRYHGRPPYILEKADPAKDVITTSWHVVNRLLYLFALADTRGRKTTDNSRAEEHLHLWKLVAEENDCLDRSFAFANDHARFLYFHDRLSSLHYVPREEFRCRVTLMTGLPGSGKDTWLAQHLAARHVGSLDGVRQQLDVDPADNQGEVIQVAKERCREMMRAGKDFAFNATNTIQQTRSRWIDLFAEYGARIEIVYLEPPLEVIFSRNAQRSKPVPKTVIERLVVKLEPPTLIEGHHVELIDNK